MSYFIEVTNVDNNGYLDIYGDTIGPKTQTNSDENELLKSQNQLGYFHPGNIPNKMLPIF